MLAERFSHFHLKTTCCFVLSFHTILPTHSDLMTSNEPQPAFEAKSKTSSRALCGFCTRVAWCGSASAFPERPKSLHEEEGSKSFISRCKMCKLISRYLAENEEDVGLDGWRKSTRPFRCLLQPGLESLFDKTRHESFTLSLVEEDQKSKHTKPLQLMMWAPAHSSKIPGQLS